MFFFQYLWPYPFYALWCFARAVIWQFLFRSAIAGLLENATNRAKQCQDFPMNRIFYPLEQRKIKQKVEESNQFYSASLIRLAFPCRIICLAHKACCRREAGGIQFLCAECRDVSPSKPILLILFAGTGGFFSSPFYRSYARFLYSLFGGGRRHLGPFDYVGSAASSSSPFLQSFGARSSSDGQIANPAV